MWRGNDTPDIIIRKHGPARDSPFMKRITRKIMDSEKDKSRSIGRLTTNPASEDALSDVFLLCIMERIAYFVTFLFLSR